VETFTIHCDDCRQYKELRSLESIAGNAMTTTLAKWIQEAIDDYHSAHLDMDRDTYLLSIPPTSTVKSYKAMKAYGYHYRVLDESNLGVILLMTLDSYLLLSIWLQEIQVGHLK
jgi:uncharacterized membrane protein YukC